MNRLFAIPLLLISLIEAGTATENPLLVSVRLAETVFKDWRYGYRLHERKINCVQFLAAVTEEMLQRELTPDDIDAIYIKLPKRRRNLDRLIERNDKRITGIQHALVRIGKGVVVRPEEAAPGDFVQYWSKRNGRWEGHSAVIAYIFRRESRLCSLVFGSHQSLGGIGVGNFEVGLNDPEVKVFIVRFRQ